MSRTEQCRARIVEMLALDPQMPSVSGNTLTALAREFAAGAMVPDNDVTAERQACLRVLCALRQRLGSCEDRDWAELEARRLNEAIASLRKGLHREDC